MSHDEDEATVARAIIDANLYMTLGTADADGEPWASPVFFAADGYTDFYWVSSPDTTHSRNIAQRPRLGIVVFDSTAPAFKGQAVYMSAVAREVPVAELDHALTVYPGPASRGGRPLRPEDVLAPGPYRLFHAFVSEHSIICPRETGLPCAAHSRAFDHRTRVTL